MKSTPKNFPKHAGMVLASAIAAFMLTACGGGSDGGTGGDPADVPLAQAPALVQQYAGLFNNARATQRSCGSTAMPAVAPFTQWNPKLQAAAQGHADDMAKNNFFSHTGSNGSSGSDRLAAVGYQGPGAAENLSKGYGGNITAITNGWLNSPGHCITIMQGERSTIAVAKSGIYTVLLVGE